MDYLVDPYAGEIVEFSKAGTGFVGRTVDAINNSSRTKKAGLYALSAADSATRAARGAWNNHRTPMAFAGGAVAGAQGERIKQHKRNKMSKAVTNPQFGTNVRRVSPLVPTGRHVSHENDLLDLKKRPRHKGPARGIERYSKRDQFEGGAVIAKRGTPMSNLAHSGRQGRRLVTV